MSKQVRDRIDEYVRSGRMPELVACDPQALEVDGDHYEALSSLDVSLGGSVGQIFLECPVRRVVGRNAFVPAGNARMPMVTIAGIDYA